MNQGASKGAEYLSKSVNKMKETISSGLIKVDNWFKRTLNDTINEFKSSVSNYVDKRIEDNKIFTENISNSRDKLLNNIQILVDEYIKSINEEVDTVINSVAQEVRENKQANLRINDLLRGFNNNMSTTFDHLNSVSQDIEGKMEKSIIQLQTNLNEKIEKLSTELQPLKEYNSEIKALLEKIQKVITSFRNLS
jgi:hypothetical protein